MKLEIEKYPQQSNLLNSFAQSKERNPHHVKKISFQRVLSSGRNIMKIAVLTTAVSLSVVSPAYGYSNTQYPISEPPGINDHYILNDSQKEKSDKNTTKFFTALAAFTILSIGVNWHAFKKTSNQK